MGLKFLNFLISKPVFKKVKICILLCNLKHLLKFRKKRQCDVSNPHVCMFSVSLKMSAILTSNDDIDVSVSFSGLKLMIELRFRFVPAYSDFLRNKLEMFNCFAFASIYSLDFVYKRLD